MKKVQLLLLMTCVVTLPKDTKKGLDYFRYFCANYYQFSGKPSNSLFWYQKLLTPETSAYGFKGYVHLLSQTGNYIKIAQLIPKLDEKMANDPHIQLIFATALGRIGKVQEHDTRIITLSKKHQIEPQIALEAAQIYLRRKEPENAIISIDAYLNKAPRKPQNFIFYFCKAQVYLELNEHEKALKAALQCTKLHPGFPKGWLLVAMLQEKAGNKQASLDAYQTFMTFSSQVPDAIKKQIEQRKARINNPLPKKNPDYDRLLQKAIRLSAQKEHSQALTIVKKLLRKKPEHVQTRLLKIHLLAQLNLVDELVATLISLTEEDVENPFWLDSLHRLSRTNIPVPKAIEALQSLEKKHPTSLLINLYLSDLYLKENDPKNAYPRLEFALNVTSNAELKVSILYQMSVIHYDNQEYKKMVSLLEQGTQLNTPHAPLYNLLAYSYAKMNTKLDEAEKLIKKALAIDPNPHFLDTHALILQAQNKQEEALEMLQQAALKAPEDSTILRHLGLVQAANGDQDSANKSYQQALAAAHTEKERKKVKRHLQKEPKEPVLRTAEQASLKRKSQHKS